VAKTSDKSNQTIENLAAEVGRFFGTTENHARKWLKQRQTLVDALSSVQARAGLLIKELTGTNTRRRKRALQEARVQLPEGSPTDLLQGRKKRRLSAATRQKMRLAAKRRWAKDRA